MLKKVHHHPNLAISSLLFLVSPFALRWFPLSPPLFSLGGGTEEAHDLSELPLTKPKKMLLLNLSLAASLLRATHWKSGILPSKEDWWAKLRFILLMSKLTALVKFRQGNLSAITKFKQQWAPFLRYDCNELQDYLQIGQLLNV